MKPLAEAAGFDPPVHKWKPEERAQLMAELDAAFFILYGIDRDDIEYILSTFQGLRNEEPSIPGMLPRAAHILETYDSFVSASG
jgi:hypothetical protein